MWKVSRQQTVSARPPHNPTAAQGSADQYVISRTVLGLFRGQIQNEQVLFIFRVVVYL